MIGCGSNTINITKSTSINCPSIFFSKEHSIYMSSISDNISLDNISYTSEINNAAFTRKCYLRNNVFYSEISLLFVIKPLRDTKQSIKLPFYIALLDSKKKLVDVQYFLSTGIFNKNLETNNIVETDIKTIENIKFNNFNQSSTFVIGFMIDKKRLQLLN